MSECGTGSGLWAHRRRGESPCEKCREFRRVQDREYRRRLASSPEAVAQRRERFGSTVAGLILDVLESECGVWLTTTEVVDRCVEVRPGVRPDTVRRVLLRIEDPSVRKRVGDGQHDEAEWMVPWRSYWGSVDG